jgi:hypothetical protein
MQPLICLRKIIIVFLWDVRVIIEQNRSGSNSSAWHSLQGSTTINSTVVAWGLSPWYIFSQPRLPSTEERGEHESGMQTWRSVRLAYQPPRLPCASLLGDLDPINPPKRLRFGCFRWFPCEGVLEGWLPIPLDWVSFGDRAFSQR